MRTSYNLDSAQSCPSSSQNAFAQKHLCLGTNESYYRSYNNLSVSRSGVEQIRSKAIACQNTFAPVNVASIQEEESEDISVVSSTSPSFPEKIIREQQQPDDCSQFGKFFRIQEEQQRTIAPLKIISNEEAYSDRVISSMRENQRTPSEFLINHTITPEIRAKMVDWMVEVTSSYGCSDQTFFLAVAYMDQFFEKSGRQLSPQDLHLTGVASMFIACKYEEIFPLHLTTFYEKIGHKKLSKEDIKRREQDILHAINFDLSSPTINDFITVTVKKLNLEQLLEPKALTFFNKMCVYLSKLACHEYSIQTQFQQSAIAGAIIYVSFKILQQMSSNFDLVSIIQQVISILQLDNEDILKSSTHVLNLARNFERCYPNLMNLKKNCADIQSLGTAAPSARAN